MLKKYLAFFTAVLILSTLTACQTDSDSASAPYIQTEFMLGSFATLQIHTEGKEYVLDKAFARIEEIETMLTVNDPSIDSQVEQINKMAGIEPVQVTEEVFYFIQRALSYTEASDGIFNVAIGPLTKLWNINFDNARRPEQNEIDEILPLLNYELITLDEGNKTVFLQKEGMRFDFGGIAKGFVADEVAQIFRENGVESGIIDLSGDVFAIGQSPRGNDWNIGIQNPFSGRGNTIGIFPVADKIVFTSGVYERYVVEDGESYHHILSAKTGFPFDFDVASLTIIADNGFHGDVYTTIAFGQEIEDALAYLESVEGVEAMIINTDKEIFLTSGIRDLFQLQDDEFTIVN